MTGKDFILYILQNDLEDKEFCEDGVLNWFLTAEQLANDLDVGVETVKAWYRLCMIDGVVIGGSVYFYKGTKRPCLRNKNRGE